MPPTTAIDQPVAEDVAPGVPTGWRGLILPTNHESGDGRVFELAEGVEPDVRPLPLPLNAQAQLADGHDGSVVIGRMTRVWNGPGGVWAEGQFDPGDGLAYEWARKLADGFAGWVSADLDRVRTTAVYLDDTGTELSIEEAAELETPPLVQYRSSSWRIMGVTLLSSPAFAEARVEPAEDVAAPIIPVEEQGPRVHTGGMIALVPTRADAARMAVDGGEPADELHTTLVYLGDDVTTWTPEQRQAVVDAVLELRPTPVEGEIAGYAKFNPSGPQPCAVYLAEAPGLTALARRVRAALTSGGSVPEIPESTYDAFIPHITAGYGMEPAHLTAVGPIRYDRIRVAMGGQVHDIPLDPITAALTAASVVYKASDFANPELDDVTPITVTPEGRVFGHLAAWGTCHIGFKGECVTPPTSAALYRYFHNGVVDTDRGEMPVGKLTLGTGHADMDLGAYDAKAHYDNTGTTVAIIRCGEDAHGIWFAGRLLPGVSSDKVDMLRLSGVSGDWRGIGGVSEMIALLAVNTPGFPIPRAQSFVASGEPVALVAAGMVMPGRTPKPAPSDGDAFVSAVINEQMDNARASMASVARDAARRRMATLKADIKRGNENALVKYWTKGKGLARWSTHPHPYTKLVEELTQEIPADEMTPEQIKGLAANYYHKVFHKWPGNRDGKKNDRDKKKG